MARFALDDAAWASRWRNRSTTEKVVLSMGLLMVAATSTTIWLSLVMLATAAVIALVLARVRVRDYLLLMLAPVAFVLVGVVAVAVHLGSAPTVAVWQWGPLSATAESLSLAGAVVARSAASFAALILLATTTPMSDLLDWLRRVRVPSTLIDIAGLIYQMIFGLLASAVTIREAQAARLGYATGPSARRSMGMLGGVVLGRAWIRARRLEAGLAGRGYTGSLRTLDREPPVSGWFLGWSLLLLATLGSLSVAMVVMG